jgi:hypothetical protein
MTDGAVAGGAAAAAIANAVRAFGPVVTVEPQDFEAILRKAEAPLVVCAQGGVFSTRYQYLTAYKGLFFYARTQTPLPLARNVETINARKFWLPG